MKNVDPTCSTTSLFGDATCLPVGPMSLDWPVNPCGRSDPSGPSLLPGAPSGAQQRGAFPAIGQSRWRQGALHAHSQISRRTTGLDGPLLSEGLRCTTWNTWPRWICFYKTKEQRAQNQLSQKTFGPQQHHLSPGGAWRGRVSSSYPGTGCAISIIWYFSS